MGASAGRPSLLQPASRNYETSRTAASWPSPACRPASTGRRCARPSAGRSWRPTSASPTTPPCWSNSAEAGRDPDRGVRLGHPRGVARAGWPRSSASGPSCRTPSRRRPTRRRWPTATCRSATRPRGRRSAWWRPPCSSTRSRPRPTRAPEFNEHGDSILAELGPRRGRHHRPQGPWRRRLSPIDNETGEMTCHLRCIPLRRQAGPGGGRGHRHGRRRRRAGPGRRRRGGGHGLRRHHPGRRQGDPRRPGRSVSIDAAVDECGGPVDALFSCAGVADGTPGIERINFIGHRHLIDRLLAAGMLGRGSAIGFISSAAGLGWEANLTRVQELLATPDFDSAVPLGRGARQGRLHVIQAGRLRLCRQPGVPSR